MIATSRATTRAILSVEAWIALWVFEVLRWRGFPAIYGAIRGRATTERRPALPVADVVWAVEEACVWYVKRVACLQRSAVTAWLLRRHGVRGELVIGYRPVPFESHAWVEVDGAVVNDLTQYQSKFTVLDRL